LWAVDTRLQQQTLVWAKVITRLDRDDHCVVHVLDTAAWHDPQRLQKLGGSPGS
jgi:hypothetical protein